MCIRDSLNPVDRDGVIAGLDLLKDAGIPIFGFDTEVADMSYLVSYAGSDNYKDVYKRQMVRS